uniref:tRNA pseudouridine synthase n=1 Tax=Steinernema glaseri TaxID=37863 RepID=A0A1I7Z8C3_9BILA
MRKGKRKLSMSSNGDSVEPKKKAKAPREFEFSRFPRRRIALQFCYLGWEYDGLVCQQDTENTIEEHIMKALEKTKLIESREIAQWTRCGRTDKGVSAFRQVAGVTVRSNLAEGEDLWWHPESDPFSRITGSNREELNYCQMLNGNLPLSIRVMAWAPVHKDFNARHNCVNRMYKYWFPLGDMNLEAMREGCRRLMGEHDFRNFCWIDKNKARLEMSYVRTISEATIEVVQNRSPEDGNSHYQLCELTVGGSGFLWHQIRCVVSVLSEIGRGNESPDVIDKLLDIETNPQRPQYGLATGAPLCLFDCSYGDSNPKWNWDLNIVRRIVNHLQMTWSDLQAKSAMVFAMMNELGGAHEELNDNCAGFEEYLRDRCKGTKIYVPLMNRPKCDSLETKQKKMQMKEAEKKIEAATKEADDP